MAGFTIDVAAYDHVKKEFLLTPYKDEAGPASLLLLSILLP
jgi:hypothetical protein